jgi:polar amino acid transport system substrate-binding protein
MTSVSDSIAAQFAPTGALRAAINLGNPVLVQKDPATGKLSGVTIDLANELARRLNRSITFVEYPAAGKVFEAIKDDVWDIAFLAIEPVRAKEIDFTAHYVLIEGTYMVHVDSPLKNIVDVDHPGVRIAVGPNSAYDLFLTRTLKHAAIVRAAQGGGRDMIDVFLAQGLEAAAGIRQPLVDYAKSHPKMRVMEGRFMEIRQAVGLQRGRPAAFRYLRDFVEEMKASGFVARSLAKSGQADAIVAPASD